MNISFSLPSDKIVLLDYISKYYGLSRSSLINVYVNYCLNITLNDLIERGVINEKG